MTNKIKNLLCSFVDAIESNILIYNTKCIIDVQSIAALFSHMDTNNRNFTRFVPVSKCTLKAITTAKYCAVLWPSAHLMEAVIPLTTC
jgi:hypothetical protein